jgi:hypothetical protein
VAQKTIRYLVSDSDDNFVGEWSDVTNEFTLKREMNNAACSLSVSLARNELTQIVTTDVLTTEGDEVLTTEDDESLLIDIVGATGIGAGTDLDLNQNIEVNAYYGEFVDLLTEGDEELTTEDDINLLVEDGAPEGYCVFRGWVSDWDLDFGDSDALSVTLLNNGVELNHIIMMDGTDTKVVFNSQDPSDIARAVIDYAQTQGAHINYDAGSIEDTGTTVSYTFNMNTISECLDKIVELCPSQWYWTYDPGNDLYSLKSRPTVPARYFTKQLDASKARLRRSIAGLVNEVYFTGGGDPALLVKTVDGAAQTAWRRAILKLSDQRVLDQTTAELLSQSEIDRYKNPSFIGNITVNGNHPTAIETIALGELAGFINFGDYLDELELQIVGLTYNVDTVDIELDRIVPPTTKRIEDLKRNLDTVEQQNNPDAPL